MKKKVRKTMDTQNKCLGPSLESFLEEEGILEEVRLNTLKATIAYQIQQAMQKAHMTKTDLAKKMGTTRASLQRLLNPQNTSVTLNTLDKAATAIGKKLYISFK